MSTNKPVKTLSDAGMRRFHDWVDEYPNKRSMLMMVLRLVEEEFGCIDDEGMLLVSKQTAREVERCLNCDIQTHFTANLCIECDACVDVCPVNCLTITPDGEEADIKSRLSAPAVNSKQDLYVSDLLPQTRRVMVKDEDICLHCGLCAERCPTAAWDMRTFQLVVPYAG